MTNPLQECFRRLGQVKARPLAPVYCLPVPTIAIASIVTESAISRT